MDPLHVIAAAAGETFGIGVIVSAFLFGFRHGIDWDHIAAITDITSTTAADHTCERLPTRTTSPLGTCHTVPSWARSTVARSEISLHHIPSDVLFRAPGVYRPVGA